MNLPDKLNTESKFQHLPRVFPTKESNLSKILSDPQFRKVFHARLKKYNPLIAGLYRMGVLPLFGINRTVMLLITRGRKSGKLRFTPIGYFPINGVIHLFSAWGKKTGWNKNMTANPEQVWIQIGFRRRPVHPYVIQDKGEILTTLEQFITESPKLAGYLFGWNPQRDRLEYADFTPIIEKVLIVRFE